MVATRGKKKSASSDMTLEKNTAAENGLAETHSDSLTIDMIKPNEDVDADALLDEKKDLFTDSARSENFGDIPGEEGEKVTHVDNENPSTPETETNEDNEAEPGENTFEDDEIDDQEDMLWADEDEAFEQDNKDRVLDEYEVSEEEATDEEDEGDEVSEEEATDENELSEEETIKEENGKENKENAEQDTRSKVKEDGRESNVKEDGRDSNKHESKSSLKNIKQSNERGRKKNGQAGRLIKVDSEDKPETSRKRKVKKRVESMGMIFMCGSGTKKDCYKYKVLGLPENKRDIVEKIYTGMRLFLYDFDLKLMYGIYKAAGPGGYNIEPKAFKSQFPSQVCL